MELKAYLAIIARRWWIIVLVTLAIGAASVYASRLISPRYQAEVNLRVITPISGSVGDISYVTDYADRLLNTYAEIATSDPVMSDLQQKLNVSTLPNITVKTVPNSEIIQISVASDDPALAAQAANTLADIIISQSQENAQQSGSNSPDLSILTARQDTLQKELDQARQDYGKLSGDYAQTTAQMSVLDSTIGTQEVIYEGLQAQYQQAVISEAVASDTPTKNAAKTTIDILSAQITSAESELSNLRQQYQTLSANSVETNQQLVSTQQLIQSDQSAYSDLLSQIDAAKIANAKRESAQDIVVASPAIVPDKPTSLSSSAIMALGVLVGLIVGVFGAFLFDNLETQSLAVAPARS